MSVRLLINKNQEKTPKIYKRTREPQRNNPVYIQRIKGISCLLCKEKKRSTTGRNHFYRSLNSLQGHCMFEHPDENYREYLMSQADKIISGVLF